MVVCLGTSSGIIALVDVCYVITAPTKIIIIIVSNLDSPCYSAKAHDESWEESIMEQHYTHNFTHGAVLHSQTN